MIPIGASGIGELIANTLAVRNVTVAVLDVNPIITENCERIVSQHLQLGVLTSRDR